MGEISLSADAIFQLLFDELRQSTREREANCRAVAERITSEVHRICRQSQRIQASGQIQAWGKTLAQHRLKQCLNYYRKGSRRGRVELHSTLSAIIYRYMTPPQVKSSYRARLTLIEDFLQGFYLEALNALRREADLSPTYSPKTLLELSEYMAFVERYGKRRIPLPGGRSQQLIILRAQTFSSQQPPETYLDLDQATEGSAWESEYAPNGASISEVREQIVSQESEPAEEALRQKVIRELIDYLEQRQQNDCADYFILRLEDLPTQEIESILGLTPRQRDYLQQRFKYHLIRFALSHRWELVHQWLEADLERNLGLTPQQWADLQQHIGERQTQLLLLKQQGASDAEIMSQLDCTATQLKKRWFKILKQAWEIRNAQVSGDGR